MKEKSSQPNREWKLVKTWSDFPKIEAICPHGIGHHKGVHGCDGCCETCPKQLWDKVTDDGTNDITYE